MRSGCGDARLTPVQSMTQKSSSPFTTSRKKSEGCDTLACPQYTPTALEASITPANTRVNRRWASEADNSSSSCSVTIKWALWSGLRKDFDQDEIEDSNPWSASLSGTAAGTIITMTRPPSNPMEWISCCSFGSSAGSAQKPKPGARFFKASTSWSGFGSLAFRSNEPLSKTKARWITETPVRLFRFHRFVQPGTVAVRHEPLLEQVVILLG